MKPAIGTLVCAMTLLGSVLWTSGASAEVVLDRLPELHRACRTAEAQERPVLYVTTLPEFRFRPHDRAGGVLAIDIERNFRVFNGSAELFPSGLESIGFPATRERAEELRRTARTLRIGFFLAFDGGQPCLIRPAAAVSTARIDLAFAELLGEDGRVLAREDTERLRAWQDDVVPEPGLSVSFQSVAGAAQVQLAATQAAMSSCFEAAAGRGVRGTSQVVFRMRVRGAVGRVDTEFSSLGDREGLECLQSALMRASASGEGVVQVTLHYRPAPRASRPNR